MKPAAPAAVAAVVSFADPVRAAYVPVPVIAGLESVIVGPVMPLGSVVDSDGTPEPFVTSTALLAVVRPDMVVPELA